MTTPGGHIMTCIFDCIPGSLSLRLGGPVINLTDSRLIRARCGLFEPTYWVYLADVCDGTGPCFSCVLGAMHLRSPRAWIRGCSKFTRSRRQSPSINDLLVARNLRP